jgi:hypothetical protein
MSLEFTGKSLAITSAGFAQVATDLGVKAPEIWTVFAVETSGCGFLPDRRPPILYERHIFSRLTGGRFDDGDISDPSPGGYGPGGAAQYGRLARAVALDRDAALQSASWGLAQIMGMNFKPAGFASAEDMVAAMCDSEDSQLQGFASFLKSSKLDGALQIHDWTSLARGYNGPNFAANQYDAKLRGEFQKFSTGALPDINTRAAQLYLTFRGFHPGPVDGVPGSLTRDALSQFQQANGLPATGLVNDATLAALTPA